VQFTINPTKMLLKHQAKTAEIAAAINKVVDEKQQQQQLTQEAQILQLGATNLTLSELVFSGSDVAKTCKQFLDWTNPTATSVDAKAPKLPRLTFKWGTISYKVNLSDATVTYVRFTPGGKPIRANVTLIFTVSPPLPTPTNPTSGGIEGRRSHTLVAGENLQHIAMANYGRPGAWRALAAANGIEDPLALRPGTVIYVPAPTELTELAGGSAG
jgi:nucleoid-associated protein YgaU